MSFPRTLLFGLAFFGALNACAAASGDDSEVSERRREADGTWETASALLFAACANVHRGEAWITVALTPSGGCGAEPVPVEVCHRYASIETTINGHSFSPTPAGGSGGAPGACRFPRFDIRSKDLFSETGSVDIGITIDGERRDFRIEQWMVTRTLDVPAGTFVPGKIASIHVGPRLEGLMGDRDRATLGSEDRKIRKTWIPVRWNGERIELPLPERIPPGDAELELEERRIAVVVGCPFAMCGANVVRTAKSSVTVHAAAE